MESILKIGVLSEIGEFCITSDDGEQLYSMIYPELKQGSTVEVDFTGVEVFSSPFFNHAIGPLLRDFERDDLNKRLLVTNINATGAKVLRLVIGNSDQYYRDPTFRNALNEVFKKQEGEE